MKKLLSFLFVGMFVFGLGFASADTLVAGTIYNSDFSIPVEGAVVSANCNGVLSVTTSLSDGTYHFEFDESQCSAGDSLNVYAEHPSYGSNSRTGIIHDEVFYGWDLAIVNVPLVPEFGVIVGMLTMISAVAVFFVVRKD